MGGKDLIKIGFPEGPVIGIALRLARKAEPALGREGVLRELKAVAANPADHREHPQFGEVAKFLCKSLDEAAHAASRPAERSEPAPYRVWGEGLEPSALEQMANASRLPVSVSGALMPDAHPGYGLPIGGVLAVDNAVIPYGVGVDIACRMKMSVFDVPGTGLSKLGDRLASILERETKFGVGAAFSHPLQHDVLDEDWNVTPMTKRVFDKARSQLGTSGSGNHFVEWGILTLDHPDLGLEPGEYLALLSHSGSRGAGAMTADYYSRLAMKLHPELPDELRRLAWLDLDTEAGQEYWAAMNLMGR